MVTSCVGAGLTGSYIFSQTVFSMRGGVTSRLQGFVIAGAPLLLSSPSNASSIGAFAEVAGCTHFSS